MRTLVFVVILIGISIPASASETAVAKPFFLIAQPNASAPARIVRAGADRVPGEYIVVFNDELDAADLPAVAAEIAAGFSAKVEKVWSRAVKGLFVKMSEAKAELLSAHPLVQFVEENAPWYFSAAHTTHVNPKTCDPTTGACPAVVDNRLWHLDRADQNYASPNDQYGYCTTGSGVTVYVLDTGVNKYHQEFGPGGARVHAGFNATGDGMPADDPCMGFALPGTGPYAALESNFYAIETIGHGHGTAVASAVGGRRVGIAKDVIIVPIKVTRCDYISARYRVPGRFYRQNETMWRPINGSNSVTLYRARNDGYAGATDPPIWPTADGATVVDNDITWEVVPTSVHSPSAISYTQLIIDGMEWILSPSNPGPKSHAILSMSMFRLPSDPRVTTSSGVEATVRKLLQNNITVITSANNQNANACDTSPARLSVNNPNASIANNVITVGGSMIINRPWPVDISDVTGPTAIEADGAHKNGSFGPQPAFNPALPVRDARWICGAGDSALLCSNFRSSQCTAEILPTAGVKPNECEDVPYKDFNGGSNAGPCVTVFAPAKNVFLAATGGAADYRDARLRAAQASGTSWATPIVAGFAARILQMNPAYTPVQVRSAILANSVPTLDPATLNTYDVDGVEITNTPNKLLRLSDVTITVGPTSRGAVEGGPTPLTVQASGTSAVQYQWYEVNPGFDYVANKSGAHASTLISGATSATYNAPTSTVTKAYWVRVWNSCGSADSDIALVVAPPAAPTNVLATASGGSVTVSWSAAAGAETYRVQRKVAGQPWTVAAEVPAGTLVFAESPTAPGGMVLYRVVSTAGSTYLPPADVATATSSNDFANLNWSSYGLIEAGTTLIRAQHVLELRAAVNALCEAAGAPPEYQPSELGPASLHGLAVQHAHFVSLLGRINSIRTHALVGVAAASLGETPAAGLSIKRLHLEGLRDALK